MTEKKYKVNKDVLKETPWGDIDKEKLRDSVMEAKNRETLVKEVYLVVEDGWEDAPSEKLKYPVMELIKDTFYYNRYGLKSALGYAKAEGESEVVSKIERLYKKFNLKDEKEEKAQMSNIKNFEIEGREAWEDIIKEVQSHEGEGAYVDSVEKDHIIYTKDDVRYRVDADIEVGKDDKTVKAKIKWDSVKEDKEQDMSEQKSNLKEDKKEEDDKKKNKMSADANVDASAYAEMLEKEAKKNKDLAVQLEEKENIIMEYEKELESLRQFKRDMEDKEKCFEVDSSMAEVKEFIKQEEFDELKNEGMACKLSEITGWKNKVKSIAFESVKNNTLESTGIWNMSNSEINTNEPQGLWK